MGSDFWIWIQILYLLYGVLVSTTLVKNTKIHHHSPVPELTSVQKEIKLKTVNKNSTGSYVLHGFAVPVS